MYYLYNPLLNINNFLYYLPNYFDTISRSKLFSYYSLITNVALEPIKFTESFSFYITFFFIALALEAYLSVFNVSS